jgi:hypothetical protein
VTTHCSNLQKIKGIIMAFLRRGLVTNKGAVPSVHTRSTVAPANQPFVTGNHIDLEREAQPAIVIKAVTKVLEMAKTANGYHLVKLTCGHDVKSKSTFQGYCRTCRH